MNNKTKKIIAIVVPIVLILLIVLAIVLVIVLHKDDGGNNPPPPDHSQHTAFKYEDETDTQHRVICEECDYIELKDHEYANDQVATCKDCHHIRTVDYPGELTTPTGVKISSDKTDLKAGDTFTLTVEISSTRVNAVWVALDVTFSPLNEEGKKPSLDISPYFEVVSRTTNIDQYIEKSSVDDISVDHFSDGKDWEAIGNVGYQLSLSFIPTDPKIEAPNIPTTQSITVTLVIKVKEDTPDVSTFAFGVAALPGNLVQCDDDEYTYTDCFDQSTAKLNRATNKRERERNVNCITCNTLLMTISSKDGTQN